MKKRYPDCSRDDADCNACALGRCGKDCHNNPMNQLQYLRTRAGLSQGQLSSASGVSVRSIQHYEFGDNDILKMSISTAAKLAKILKCSLDDFI